MHHISSGNPEASKNCTAQTVVSWTKHSAHLLLKFMANPEAQCEEHRVCVKSFRWHKHRLLFLQILNLNSWQLWWPHLCLALCPASRIMHSWLNKPKQEIQHLALACMVSLLPWNGSSTEERLTEKLTILNLLWDEEDDRVKTGKPGFLASFAKFIREYVCPCHNV